jgi:hypothetical protein
MQVFRVIYERLLSQGIILPSQVGGSALCVGQSNMLVGLVSD